MSTRWKSLGIVFCMVAFLLSALPSTALAETVSAPDPQVQTGGIVPTWTLRTGSLMDPRTAFGMDFDPLSGQVAVFGGSAEFQTLNDLWILPHAGSTWTPLSTSSTPNVRFETGMVFLGASGKALLFGGQVESNGDYLDDTQLLDLASRTWQRLSTPTAPCPRAGFSLVWTRGRAILFGGHDDARAYNDTWSFDPTSGSWTELSPANPPNPRAWAAMSTDPISGKAILFGGFDGVSLDDTWVYDPIANTWTQLHPAVSPSARANCGCCFLQQADKVLLYGGIDNATQMVTHETWLFDPQAETWQQVPTQTEPTPSHLGGMAYDARLKRAILFGGTSDLYPGDLNETWAFDERTFQWNRLDVGDPPGARSRIDGAYDSKRGIFTIFGGTFGSHDGQTAYASGETWRYDVRTNAWSLLSGEGVTVSASPSHYANQNLSSQFSSSSPPARYSACFTYSPTQDLSYLFGGMLPLGMKFYNDLWTLSPSGEWTELDAADPPPELSNAAMVANPDTGQLLVFGGHNPTTFKSGKTYLYDPVTNAWTTLDLSVSPSPRYNAKMVWDETNKRALLFAGQDPDQDNPVLNDLWAFDFTSRTWSELHPANAAPPTRASFGFAWDSLRQRAVVYGGVFWTNGNGWSTRDDTWAYDPQTNAWTELQPTVRPPTEADMAMVYDSIQDQVLIFGGEYLHPPGSHGEYPDDRQRNDCWALTFQTSLAYHLTSGWNLITVPLRMVPSSTDQVFPSGSLVFTWDAVQGRYLSGSQISVVPGAGYWLRSAVSAFTLVGAPPAASEYTLSLGKGWNLIGNPFANDVSWSRVSVLAGSQRLTLEQAVAGKMISPLLLAWLGDRYIPLLPGGAFPAKAGFWLLAKVPGLQLAWTNP